jgi:hypothetical protein
MNDWLLIPLTVIAFTIVACAILAIIFGLWLGTHWVAERLGRSARFGPLRRS